MSIQTVSKSTKIAVVTSCLWLLLATGISIEHEADALEFILFGIAPVVILWGTIWIRAGSIEKNAVVVATLDSSVKESNLSPKSIKHYKPQAHSLGKFKDPTALAYLLIGLCAILAILGILGSAYASDLSGLYISVYRGDLIPDSRFSDLDKIGAVILGTSSIVCSLTALLFIAWLSRVNGNLVAFNPSRPRFTNKQVITYCLLPPFFFFRPYQIAHEVTTHTAPLKARLTGKPCLNFGWLGALLSGGIVFCVDILMIVQSMGGARLGLERQSQLLNVAMIATLLFSCSIVAATAWIWSVTKVQKQEYETLVDAGESVPEPPVESHPDGRVSTESKSNSADSTSMPDFATAFRVRVAAIECTKNEESSKSSESTPIDRSA